MEKAIKRMQRLLDIQADSIPYDPTLKSSFTLTGGTADTSSTSLSLTGKGFINWGALLQENLIHLLENFASNGGSPESPTMTEDFYFSQKSALDLIDVNLLLKKIKKSLHASILEFLFEPNDEATHRRLVSRTERSLNQYKKRGLNDYLIFCDERNNPLDKTDLTLDVWVQMKKGESFTHLQTKLISEPLPVHEL